MATQALNPRSFSQTSPKTIKKKNKKKKNKKQQQQQQQQQQTTSRARLMQKIGAGNGNGIIGPAPANFFPASGFRAEAGRKAWNEASQKVSVAGDRAETTSGREGSNIRRKSPSLFCSSSSKNDVSCSDVDPMRQTDVDLHLDLDLGSDIRRNLQNSANRNWWMACYLAYQHVAAMDHHHHHSSLRSLHFLHHPNPNLPPPSTSSVPDHHRLPPTRTHLLDLNLYPPDPDFVPEIVNPTQLHNINRCLN